MPSQNTEGNMIIMDYTDQGDPTESQLGDKVEKGDKYFFYNDTKEYFPTLRFNPEYIPFGDASAFCLHLQWIKKDMKKMYDMYKNV